jgi:hypothetical protein
MSVELKICETECTCVFCKIRRINTEYSSKLPEAVNCCNVHCEAELTTRNSMELNPMTPCSQVKTNLDYHQTTTSLYPRTAAVRPSSLPLRLFTQLSTVYALIYPCFLFSVS